MIIQFNGSRRFRKFSSFLYPHNCGSGENCDKIADDWKFCLVRSSIISIFIVSKLTSQDLKEVILKVLVIYGWLGYPVAAITIFVSVRVLRWRENFYQQEMARIAGVRNQLMQTKLELPLQSSVEKKEDK
jgi:hypothetical protein